MNEGEAEAPRPQSLRPISIATVRCSKLLELAKIEAENGEFDRLVLVTMDHEGHVRVRSGGLVLDQLQLLGLLLRATDRAL